MRSLWVIALCASIIVLASGSRAAAQSSGSAPPAVKAPTAAQAANAATAPPSMKGPARKMAGGGLLIGAGVLTGLAVGVMAGPGVLECFGATDQDECKEQARRKRERGKVLGVAVAVPIVAGGVIMLVRGAKAAQRVREERRRLSLSSASLDVDHSRAGLHLQFSF